MEAFNTGRHSFNFSDADLDNALVNLNDPNWKPSDTPWESAKPKGEVHQPVIGRRIAPTPQPLKRSEGTPLGRAMSHLHNGVELNAKEMTTLGKAIASTKSIARLIPNTVLKALPDAFCKKLAAKSILKTNFAFVTKEFGIKDKKELAELKKLNFIPNNKLLTKDSESEIKGAASHLREAKQTAKQDSQITGWLKKLANKLGERPLTLELVRISDREKPRETKSREENLGELNNIAQEVGVDKFVKGLQPILKETFIDQVGNKVGYNGIYSLGDKQMDQLRQNLGLPSSEVAEAAAIEEREKEAALRGKGVGATAIPENMDTLAAFEDRVQNLRVDSGLKRIVTILMDNDRFDKELTSEVRSILNDNVLAKMEAGGYSSQEIDAFTAILTGLHARRREAA
ncbi:MAG: hypothetical protein Q8K75_10195 [Chlamydiales bacterium]|nr:hypothetical protein [Chlamydiales bacterium]